MVDPLARNEEFERRLALIPEGDYLPKPWLIAAFGVIVSMLAGALVLLATIGWQTRRVVVDEIPPLKDKITEQAGTIAVQEDLVRQQTDAIVLLIGILRENDIEPPPIVIRPTTTTTEP